MEMQGITDGTRIAVGFANGLASAQSLDQAKKFLKKCDYYTEIIADKIFQQKISQRLARKGTNFTAVCEQAIKLLDQVNKLQETDQPQLSQVVPDQQGVADATPEKVPGTDDE